MKKKSDIENIKESFIYLEQIIPTIDKIGSDFSDRETTALALLLFFKEEKILDKLSYIRKIMNLKLSFILSNDEYELLLGYINYWELPHSKEEILSRLKKKCDTMP
jgi:hypothetical protein